MDFIFIQVITFILAIGLSYYFLLKDKLTLVPLILVYVTLAHKEYFGLVVKDFLPIRGIFVGVLIYLIVKTLSALKTGDIRIFTNNIMNRLREYSVQNLTIFLLTTIAIISIVSVPFSDYFIYSASLAIFWLGIIFLYYLVYYLFKLDREKFISLFINYSIYITLALSVFTFLQIALRYPKIKEILGFGIKIGAIYTDVSTIPRVGALFWDVNHYGAYLLFPLFLIIAKFFNVRILKQQLYWLSILGVVLLSLVLTQSRSAMLGFLAGVIVLLIVYLSKKFYYAFQLLGISLFIFLVLSFSAITYLDYSFGYLINKYGHLRLDSFNTHLTLVKGASEILTNHPLTGVGIGNFTSGYVETKFAEEQFKIEPNLRGERVPTHTFWGELIAELGIIGLTAYLIFFTYSIVSLVMIIDRETDVNGYLMPASLLSGFVAINVAGLFYSYKLEFFWMYIFFCLFYVEYVSKTESIFHQVVKYLNYRKTQLSYAIITLFSVFFIFIGLGANALIDFDEAIYAKVAKNILLTGDYLSLHWTSLTDYWFEKPPLIFILMATSIKIFGLNEFAVRLPSALMGLLTVIYAFKLSKRYFSTRVAFISSFVLLSTTHFILYARKSMIDIAITFITICVIYYFDKLLNEDYFATNKKKFYLYGIAISVLISMGILFKSIIGLLPLVIIFLHLLLDIKNKYIIKMLKFSVISAIGLLIALSWYLYSYIVHGYQFIEVHIFEHILNRASSGLGHSEAWNFYLITLKTTMRIWFIPLLCTPVLLFSKYSKKNIFKILIAFFCILLIFSTSSDKLQWYIMPIYTFSAIIVALVIDSIYMFIIKYIGISGFKKTIIEVGYLTLIISISIFYIVFVKEKFYPPDTNNGRREIAYLINDKFPINKSNPSADNIYIIGSPRHFYYFYINNNPIEVSLSNLYDKIGDQDLFGYKIIVGKESDYLKLVNNKQKVADNYEIDFIGKSGEWVLMKSKSNIELMKSKQGLIKNELMLYDSIIESGKPLSIEGKNMYDKLFSEELELRRQILDYENNLQSQ